MTSPTDPARRFKVVPTITSAATATIVVDPSALQQPWRGVGASLTDASVGLLEGNRTATEMLFSPTRADGARLNWLRLPLSSTDFSPRLWSWTAAGAPPAQQTAAVRYLIDEVLPVRRSLSVVATAWSAPASMKQPATLRGGSLRSASEPAYGDLLVKQASWLKEQGVPLRAMAISNEPDYAPDYTSMKVTAPQQIRIANAVSSRLTQRSVQLWAVDHNWEHRPAYDEVLAGARSAFAAAAVHCYGGTPGQMAGLPVRTVLTECTGTTDTWSGTFRWDAINLITTSIEAGSTGLMMWNLALNASNGPIDPVSAKGCKSCRGLLTISGDLITPGPEFFTLGHVARAARPGARVISSASEGGVVSSAFLNSDGTIGVVGHNQSSSEEVVDVRVRGRNGVRFRVGPGELFTFTGPSTEPVTDLRNAVVQASTGERYLIDRSGYRHRITSASVDACLGAPVRTLTSLAPYPLGEDAGCPPTRNSVYSSPDGASYLVTGYPSRPRRRWMPTGEAYWCAVGAGYPVVQGPTYVVREVPMGQDLPKEC